MTTDQNDTKSNHNSSSTEEIQQQSKSETKSTAEADVKDSTRSSFSAPFRNRKLGLAELKLRFGPPPVLSSESMEHYYEILTRLLNSFRPLDQIKEIFIKDIADATWEVMRYKRYKTIYIENTFRENKKREEQNRKAREKARADFAEMMARKSSPDADRARKAADVVDSTVSDVDSILDQRPKEFGHHQALRQEIGYFEQLERLQDRAMRRLKEALEQLERYQENLGAIARQVTDELIDGECQVVDEGETSIVPSDED